MFSQRLKYGAEARLLHEFELDLLFAHIKGYVFFNDDLLGFFHFGPLQCESFGLFEDFDIGGVIREGQFVLFECFILFTFGCQVSGDIEVGIAGRHLGSIKSKSVYRVLRVFEHSFFIELDSPVPILIHRSSVSRFIVLA